LWVLPVLLPREAPVPVRTMRIAYANVNAWSAPSASSMAWFSASDADVVAIVECSAEWADALGSVAGPGGARWPHAFIRADGHAMSGVAVLSRHALRDAKAFVSPEGRFPMVDVTVDAPDGPLRIMVAHPVPPVSADAARMRDSEIRWLAQRCSDSGMPTAIVADFNDTPFGRALAAFGARSGMRSAASATGLVTTWPARVGGIPWPPPLRIAIDHCFVSPGIGIAGLAAGPDIGSDHLPLLIDIAHGAANPRIAD
ncbi:MAG: endonuclease/exonuclease/phosphatase family protein, partial [Phycisphaerales bacterium]|nr:endonuclease/exonuclease/phosphatase family protein [Phycisphaerales bacterium]